MQRPSRHYYERNERHPLGVQEQMYGVRYAIENFLTELLFPADESRLSRVIWADPEYSLDMRIEQLADLQLSDVADQWQLPYISYFRTGSWTPDARTGGATLGAALQPRRWGADGATGFEARAILAERTFEASVMYSSDHDAQVAINIAQWWRNRIWYGKYALTVNGEQVDVPVQLVLDDVSMMEEKDRSPYLKQQNIHIVHINFIAETPLLRVPEDTAEIFIAEDVAFYFHNKHFNVPAEALPPLDDLSSWQELSSSILELHAEEEEVIPDSPLTESLIHLTDLVFEATAATSTKLTWDYQIDSANHTHYPGLVKAILHKGTELVEYEVIIDPLDPTTELVIDGLDADSIYDILIKAKYYDAEDKLIYIGSYRDRVETPAIPDRAKGLAGLQGLTF